MSPGLVSRVRILVVLLPAAVAGPLAAASLFGCSGRFLYSRVEVTSGW